MAHWMAVEYARKRQWQRGSPIWRNAWIEDYPPADHAISVMNEIGIDISHHRCSGLNTDDIAWSDYILVMTIEHASQLTQSFQMRMVKSFSLAHLVATQKSKTPIKAGNGVSVDVDGPSKKA